MITLIIAVIFSVATTALFVLLSEIVRAVVDKMTKKEESPKTEKPYMDNSEYDWGHNIRNYMED